MKQVLLILAVAIGQSVLAADKKPLIADPIVEKEIRAGCGKPKGELTKADLAKVTFLYFTRTKITDAGLKDIAKLPKPSQLYLDNTKITDAGLKDIAKLQQLRVLSLNFTKITDAGLKDIAKLQKLTRLNLYNTKITDEGVAELRKALPKCKIYHSYKKDYPPKPTPPKPTPPKAFVNSLGMPFVPVPGAKVQFCIWETRVKDYAAYAAANAGGGWELEKLWPRVQAGGHAPGGEGELE